MKKLSHILNFEEYDSIDELDSIGKKLIEIAQSKLENAYAPYSKFKVSAALLMGNGEIICGNNQENAAYPSGLCAERTAIFYAMSRFPHDKIKAIAVVAQNESNTLHQPVTPCGACRQVISEYEKKDNPITLYFQGSKQSKIWKFNSNCDLLPFGFEASSI